MNHAEAFRAFSAAVAARLEEGEKLYADRSFRREPEALVGEVEEELLDVCAWSFILWCRMQAVRGVIVDGQR